MKRYIILTCCLSIVYLSCINTGLSQKDISRKKANIILESTDLKNKLDDPYMFFSIKNKFYYIVVKKENSFNEFFIVLDSLNHISDFKSSIVKNPKEILEGSFNKNQFYDGFIDLNSSFYKNGYDISDGNPTYFFFKDEDDKIYGELVLTTIIQPIPINNELYYYMMTKALSIVEQND